MSHSRLHRVCLVVFFVVGSLLDLSAQSYSGINWYFGNNTNSIRFTRPTLAAENVTLPGALGVGGGAVATDPVTGEIWFYTDGVSVFDRTDFNLTNAINGSTTRNQSVAVAENPANRNEYFLFTIGDTGTLFRSIFDKTEFRPGSVFPEPPNGNFTDINQPVPALAGPLSEGMIIVSNDTQDGYWLITQSAGGDINVTQLDGTATFTTTTFPTTLTNISNFSFNATTNRLALTSSLAGEGVEILDIDLATGALSASGIDLSAITFNGIYDTEWNNNGQYLYVSGNFGEAQDSLARIDIVEVPPVFETIQTFDVVNSFGIQMAPDSAIYHLFEDNDGLFRLGRIDDPDTSDIGQVLYDPRPFVDIDQQNQVINDIDFAAQQFSAFLPFIEPDFTVDFTWFGECQNEEVFFFPEISEVADSVVWDFGDGNGSGALSPVHTYSEAQDFTVTLTAFVNGVGRQATDTVTINPFEVTIDVITDTTFCRENFIDPYGLITDLNDPELAQVVAQVDGAASVTWFNGLTTQTGNTLVPDSAGIYWIVASDGSGCSTSETVTVNTYGENEQRGFVWYFGTNAGIDFNPITNNGPVTNIPFGDPNIFNGGNQMTTPEGTAIYNDPNGQPLFYSDGNDVYDREGNLLTPTDKLGGSNESSQSVLILPFPDDETLYYIFTTEEVYNTNNEYNLRYAIFDLKRNNGLGELVRNENGEISTVLCTGITERITGSENWVIVHELGNNNFKAFPVAAAGIGNAVISNVGSVHGDAQGAQGYMVLEDNDRLAVAFSESDTENFVELFDFDAATGAITAFIVLDFNDPDRASGPSPVSGQVYGVEISGSNVFATIRGTAGSQIYLWHLDSARGGAADPTYIRDSVEVVDISNLPANVQLGAIEQGPDGVLYIAMDGEQQVATITNPGTRFGDPVPQATLFGLAAGTDSQLGLPNFIQDPFGNNQNASITPPNGCSGDSFTFTVQNPLDISLELYQLNIYDPSSILVQSETLSQDNTTVTYTFTDPGEYTMEFTIQPQCLDLPSTTDLLPGITTTQTFSVNPLPTIQEPIQITAIPNCDGNDGAAEVIFTTSGQLSYTVSGPVSYPSTPVISNGSTAVTIPGLRAGAYTLNVRNDATGCTDNFTFSLNNPTTYNVAAVQSRPAECDNTGGEITYALSGAGVPTIFTWELRRQVDNVLVTNGDQNDPSQVISPVNTGDYTFSLTDDSQCLTTVNVSVNRPPTVQLSVNPGPIPACDDEAIQVDLSSNSQEIVRVTQLDGSPAPNVNVIGANEFLEVTNPGVLSESITYAVTALGDNINTCDTTAFVTISFGESSPNPFDSRYALCPFEQDPARRFVMLENPPGGFSSVVWLDRDGNEITNATPGYRFSSAGDSLIVENLGRISAELTNPFGCITEADIDIIQDCEGRINAPTAFYPNSMINNNRQFIIFPFLVLADDFEIFIFNRWGEMIFQSDDLEFMRTQGWNGGYDNDPGRPVQGGTYAYRINFRGQFDDVAGDPQEQRGSVTLIR